MWKPLEAFVTNTEYILYHRTCHPGAENATTYINGWGVHVHPASCGMRVTLWEREWYSIPTRGYEGTESYTKALLCSQ